ncbi:MAG: choice-of-anchor D domain-containing protein, partial [Myxococcota bacterium]
MRRLLPSLGLFLATLAGCQCGNVRIGTVRPQIEADPASLDFGSTAVGFPVEKNVALLNQSHAVLHLEEVTIIGEAAQAFSTSLPEVVDVEAGASVSVRVVYSPGAEGNHSARLLVRSDAANAPELLVPLAGTALPADPCAQVVCDSPPGPCFQEWGVCAGGSCTYLPKDEGTQCNDGNDCTEADMCRAGSCQGTPKACTTPLAGSCSGQNNYVSYESPGTCVNGACQYAPVTSACAGGCSNNVCQPGPCTGVTCNNPPPCFKGGTCVGGACQYQVDVGAPCNDGNACTEGDTCNPSGVCAGAPKSCNTPPPSTCLDAQSQRSYDSVGSCGAGGTCSYTSRDVTCALGCD